MQDSSSPPVDKQPEDSGAACSSDASHQQVSLLRIRDWHRASNTICNGFEPTTCAVPQADEVLIDGDIVNLPLLDHDGIDFEPHAADFGALQDPHCLTG